MKNLLIYSFWIMMGGLLAYLLLIFQRWSVEIIQPSKPVGSKWLIIGGAIIRWCLISLLLLFALFYDLWALFLTFSSFMIFRLLILALWQKSFNMNDGSIH